MSDYLSPSYYAYALGCDMYLYTPHITPSSSRTLQLPPKALMSKFRPVHKWTLRMQIRDAMHSFTTPVHTNWR